MNPSTDRHGKPAVSHLELLTRYTTAVWQAMHEMKMQNPSSRPIAGAQAPLSVNRKLGVLKQENESHDVRRIYHPSLVSNLTSCLDYRTFRLAFNARQ